jgi:hypothetical protein
MLRKLFQAYDELSKKTLRDDGLFPEDEVPEEVVRLAKGREVSVLFLSAGAEVEERKTLSDGVLVPDRSHLPPIYVSMAPGIRNRLGRWYKVKFGSGSNRSPR